MKKEIRTNYDKKLFNSLTESRNDLAKEKNVAGFIILSDAVLKELAYFYPINKDGFLLIKGIGENKFNLYGEKFISIINSYIKSENISNEILNTREQELKKYIQPEKPKINVKERTETRKARVKELIEQKMSIEDMANDLDLTSNTIVNYIGRLLTDDSSLDVKYIKESVAGYSDIVKAFKKYGTEKIGPIYAEFSGNVEYADIILVKVLMLSK
ncbi:MAG TPA: HRDC domain-containing protein [Candidatus Nanoarchaeia archaeon]|nr:HRDC domain-containing protein [Candidatus Nanoarchaeia archaeon]